jgi:TonB family protein
MSIYDQNDQKSANRVFISYSSIDRFRVNGLGLLLEAMGHRVFHDHRTIKPGMRWEAALQEGLEDADVLMVFWTRHASRSDWVRKEYEYFAGSHPDRSLVPVLGDETPLAELLKTRQHADFAPVVNEVLAMKRKMKRQGLGSKAIEQAVVKRLDEAGVEVQEKDRKWLFLFLGFGWLLSLLRYPGSSVKTAGSAAAEKTAQVTLGQAAALGAAALIGLGGSYPVIETLVQKDRPADLDSLRREGAELRDENQRLRDRLEGGSCLSQDDLDQQLAFISDRLDDLAQCREEISSLRREISGLDATRASEPGGLDRGTGSGPDDQGIGESAGFSRQADAGERPSGLLRDDGDEEGGSAAEGQIERPDIEIEPPDAEGAFIRPRLVFDPQPEYPRSARRSRVEGTVDVRGLIDETGRVSVEAIETGGGPGQEAFGEAARSAIRRWRFEPARLDGRPIAVTMRVTVKFVLDR